jgi:hypothetical protein
MGGRSPTSIRNFQNSKYHQFSELHRVADGDFFKLRKVPQKATCTADGNNSDEE